MSKTHQYSSVFAPYIKSFLQIKSAVISNTAVYGFTLKQWDEAMIQNKRSDLYVTKEMVLEWEKSLYPTSDRTSYTKHVQLVQFLKYLCRLGLNVMFPAYLSDRQTRTHLTCSHMRKCSGYLQPSTQQNCQGQWQNHV